MKSILLNYSEDELKELLVTNHNFKKFRAKQVYEWLTSYVYFDQMSNISLEERKLLAENYIAKPIEIFKTF